MQRWLAIMLLLSLMFTGCTGKRQTPPPAPLDTPANPNGRQPEPDGGPKDLIGPAPAGSMKRIHVKPGQPIDRTGLFFMNVETSEVEGWAIDDDPNSISPSYVSADNRWIGADQFLADRKAGTVYRLAAGARLVEARGDVLLFMAGSRFWVVRDGLKWFQAVDLAPVAQPQAVISPDGRSLVLVNGTAIYLIQSESGQVRGIGKIAPQDAPGQHVNTTLTAGRMGEEVIVSAAYNQNGPVTRIYRYSWQGSLLDERSAPGPGHFSPDGKLVAWHDDILGLTHAMVVGSADFQPRLRIKGEQTCSLPNQGPYWLPDSSGLVVSTTRGPRLLKVDGTLEKLAAVEALSGREMPVPAPDRPNRFAVGGMTVVDGSGKKLALAVPHSPGRWYGVGALHPWGDRSDEVRFILKSSGRGVSCDPPVFPPEAERAPFPAITGLAVNVAGGDCVNLRQHFTKEAPVITCLPNGARLSAAWPPGVNNKGELQRWGNPMAIGMGDEWWWYVRTDQGQRGWVYLSDEYLTWAVAQPGEPAQDPLLNRVEDELVNLRFWLRVAAGEERCGASCASGPSLTDAVSGLMTWCKQGPEALRSDSAFDPARHGPGVTALENTCKALQSASDSLGQLDEGPAWKQKVKDLLAGLDFPSK